MYNLALTEAETKLAKLINMVASGEDVVITRNDGSAYKIVPIAPKKPYPKFGSAEGMIEMSDDFDEPIEEFREYMP